MIKALTHTNMIKFINVPFKQMNLQNSENLKTIGFKHMIKE